MQCWWTCKELDQTKFWYFNLKESKNRPRQEPKICFSVQLFGKLDSAEIPAWQGTALNLESSNDNNKTTMTTTTMTTTTTATMTKKTTPSTVITKAKAVTLT